MQQPLMTDPNTSHQSETVFDTNIAALRAVDADLADRLASLTLPPEIVPTMARDGSPTYKIRAPAGERWFGFTSMPTVSGPALLRSFDPGDGNVLLAGIGQGIEARLMVDSLGANRAVFVLERDPLMVALALRLHDVSAAIEHGRLPLLVGEDPVASLVRFLIEHEGYTAPTRMLGWPWMSQTELDEMKGLLERSADQAARHRATALAEVIEQLAVEYSSDRPLPDRPRTLVICPHARSDICRFAADVLRGLDGLDWPAEGWLGNNPQAGHPLALARRLLAHRPDMVVLIDAVRAGFAAVLPASIPLATWFTPWARVPSTVADGIGAQDRVFAMTAAARSALVAAGLDADRVQWLGPALPSPPSVELSPDHAFAFDVVAVSDAPPLDAASQGLTLGSHRSLWEIAQRMIKAEVERYTAADVQRILKRAEAETGASFEDAAFRQDISDRINAVLGQTLVGRAAYEAAVQAGVPLAIAGRGWERYAELASACRGAPPGQGPSGVYASAKIVLHVDVTGNVTPQLLAAASSGAAVVARAHPTDQADCGLSQLLRPGSEVLTFTRHSEMIRHLKQLLNDEPARRAMAERARTRLAEAHTMAHRLTTIRTALDQDSK